jgi:ketosteroid isomerase-like protein
MTPEEQIRKTIAAFAEAYRSRNLEAIGNSYSDDLIKDRAGFPGERKPETLDRIRQVFAECDTQIYVSVDELHVSGDLAYVRGWFSVTLTVRSSEETKHFRRRYLEIWCNEGGTWRVIRTMDNESTS